MWFRFCSFVLFRFGIWCLFFLNGWLFLFHEQRLHLVPFLFELSLAYSNRIAERIGTHIVRVTQVIRYEKFTPPIHIPAVSTICWELRIAYVERFFDIPLFDSGCKLSTSKQNTNTCKLANNTHPNALRRLKTLLQLIAVLILQIRKSVYNKVRNWKQRQTVESSVFNQ